MKLASGTPVLFIHGFWHGSWCWSEVLARLASSGTRAVAVDLAGHGLRARYPAAATRRPFDPALMASEPSPVAGVGLDEIGDLLVSQLRELGGGRPVVAVAHSGGGIALTRVAQEAPGLVGHAVYLSAVMPASGWPGFRAMNAPENEGSLGTRLLVAHPDTTGALRIDPLSDDPHYRELVRTALYGDVRPEVAEAAMRLMTPDTPARLFTDTTTLTADRWGHVSRSFVVCTRDMVLRPTMARKYIADADAAFPDNPTTVYTLDSSHSPFLSMPGKVADVVNQVLAA